MMWEWYYCQMRDWCCSRDETKHKLGLVMVENVLLESGVWDR